MSNLINPSESLYGTISEEIPSLKGTISSDSPSLSGSVTIPKILDNSDIEVYQGTCDIIPKADSPITLETKNKRLNDDIIIEKIPYFEVSNEDGGITVIIG